jgi:rare lipoprotein A (peptidoglycan hydrolase)
MNPGIVIRIATLLAATGIVWAVAHEKSTLLAKEVHSRGRSSIVCATWYRVPADSLARRRAGKNELTAAHNRLPLGTVVRVTNLSNKQSALVRITDRGIPRGSCPIDICQEAAEQLGMLSKGITRVRLEILPNSTAAINPEENRPAAP